MRFLVQVFYRSTLDRADVLVNNLGTGLPGIVAKALGGEKGATATHSDVTVIFQPFGSSDRHSSDLEIFIHAPGHDRLTNLNGRSRAGEIAEALKQSLQPIMQVEGFVAVYIGESGFAQLGWSGDAGDERPDPAAADSDEPLSVDERKLAEEILREFVDNKGTHGVSVLTSLGVAIGAVSRRNSCSDAEAAFALHRCIEAYRVGGQVALVPPMRRVD